MDARPCRPRSPLPPGGASELAQTTLLRDAVLVGNLPLCAALLDLGADADDGSIIVAASALGLQGGGAYYT